MDFSYSKTDLKYQPQRFDEEVQNNFDKKLEDSFQKSMDAGMLRYIQPKGANDIKVIKASNGCTMVAEFNHNRGFNKRARDPFPSVSIPFNEDKFNFNKIKKEEILFELKPEDNLQGRGEIIQALVNISPINFCHNLYVIDPKKNLPQRLTKEACRVAFDLVRLSNSPGFRTMFNSLQAWASVNHLHIHSMNVPYQLGMDVCPSLPLQKSEKTGHDSINGKIRQMDPSRTLFDGFVLNSKSEDDIDEIVILMEKMVKYFHDNEIPYNVVWSRGSDVNTQGELENYLVRVLIWPRFSGEGLLPHPAFDNACAELDGHLPIKTREEFDKLTGESALERLHTSKLSKEKFDSILNDFAKF